MKITLSDQAFATLFEQYTDPPILLAGDMNPRIGGNNYKIGDALALTAEDLNYLPERNSKDPGINKAGKSFFGLIYKYHLYICNGTQVDPDSSLYTFIGPKGKSVIHYIVLSCSAWPFIEILKFLVGLKVIICQFNCHSLYQLKND